MHELEGDDYFLEVDFNYFNNFPDEICNNDASIKKGETSCQGKPSVGVHPSLVKKNATEGNNNGNDPRQEATNHCELFKIRSYFVDRKESGGTSIGDHEFHTAEGDGNKKYVADGSGNVPSSSTSGYVTPMQPTHSRIFIPYVPPKISVNQQLFEDNLDSNKSKTSGLIK